jgi:outer membrane protein assembly factor BamB
MQVGIIHSLSGKKKEHSSIVPKIRLCWDHYNNVDLTLVTPTFKSDLGQTKAMAQSFSRRDVLAGGLALGGAVSLGLPASAESAAPRLAPDPNKFIWFSDTHVSLGRNGKECLEMVKEISGILTPAFIVNGGDVTDYGWNAEVDDYQAVLKACPAPVRHVPGNHDVRWSPMGPALFKRRLGGTHSALDWGPVRVLLLDTTVPLSHWGTFSRTQLDWLESELKKVGREAPVILGMHHWVGRDKPVTDNEEALRRLVEPYNVKLIMTGHGHTDDDWQWDGIHTTMCRGLYQKSWQMQEIKGGKLFISRRGEASKGRLVQKAEINLAPDKSKKPLWPAALGPVNKGEELALPAAAESHSWNRGGKVLGGPAETEKLVPGRSELTVTSPDGRLGRFTVLVKSGAGLVSEWEAPLKGGVISHLKTDGGQVFVSTLSGTLEAFEASTGKALWSAKFGDACHSSPLVTKDLIWVGSSDEHLYGVDRKTGAAVRKVKLTGPVYSSPAIAKGVIGVAAGEGDFFGIDPATGAIKWKVRLSDAQGVYSQSPVGTDGERFYVGAWDSTLYAIAADGTRLWGQGCCADMSFLYSPAIGGPAVWKDRVAVPANGNRLYCFETKRGSAVWIASSPGDKFGYSSPTWHEGKIYIGCLGDKGEFRSLDAATGKELWTCATGDVIYDSSPCVVGSGVAVISVSGLVTLAGLTDGKVLGQHRLGPHLGLSSPASDGTRLFVASLNEVLSSLRLK